MRHIAICSCRFFAVWHIFGRTDGSAGGAGGYCPGSAGCDTARKGDLCLQEHRAAAHGTAAEAAEGRAAACGKGGTDAGRADARPNAKGEHTWTCVIRLLRLPAALEERADEQDDHKDDEVEQHLDMVGADGGVYHEQGAQGGQDGHDLAAEGGQIIALHQGEVDGDVQRVQGDDGQLGGVEAEGSEPAGGQICAVEVHQPQAGDEDTEHGGVGGHIGGGIDIAEHGQLLVLAVGGQVIHTAGNGHHQTVAGAPAGDGDEGEDSDTAHLAKDVHKRALGAGLGIRHEGGAVDGAGEADVVHHVDDGHDDGADQQGLGQIALGVLQLGADGGGTDPALEGEGQGHDAAEQAGQRRHGGVHHVGKVVVDLAVAQAHDGADNGHQQQGDELDDRGADLELTGQFGGQGVHQIGDDHEEDGQGHHGAAGGVFPADQHAEVAGGEPAQHAHQGGVVYHGHEPAHIVAVRLAAGGLGKAHQAVHALMALGHDAEGAGADDHHDTHDDKGQDADTQVAAGALQHGLSLEEDTGADDGAHHHGDGYGQSIPFFHNSVFLSDLSS